MGVDEELQVLIVGAGVGGLALARGLHRGGMDPVVVERDRAPPDHGGPLALWRGGRRRLADLGVADAVQSVGTGVEGWTIRDGDGAVSSRLVAADGETPFRVLDRSRLRTCLRETLPTDTVRAGTTLSELDCGERGVTVAFSHGVTEQFDAVVGADGVHSRVRALSAVDGRAGCGTASWSWRVDSGVETPAEPTEIWGADGTVALLLPGPDRPFAWVTTSLGAPGLSDVPDQPAPAEVTDHSASSEVPDLSDSSGSDAPDSRRPAEPSSALPAFPDLSALPVVPDLPAFTELSAGVDGASVRRQVDYRVRTDTWVDGRVALLGDAAHALHPLSGLGASLALSDAAALADELCNRDDAVPARLQDYAGRRRSHLRKLRRSARLSGAFGFTDSPLVPRIREALAVRAALFEAAFRETDGESATLLETL